MTNYFDPTYDDKSRWMSYWYQIREILNFNPQKILVIGKGNGLVSDYFKLYGAEVITLDIDESLKPDAVSSVLNMPFGDNFFDMALCAQVLEHLPYNDFPKALFEIKRVVKSGAVISLPHFGPAIKFLLKLPFLPEIKFLLKLHYLKRRLVKKEHFWEIGEWGLTLKKIKKNFENAGFLIEKDYVIFEKPLHHFFILKK